MRIPLAKVYRAFPELDAFSDEQCEVYAARARTRRRSSTFFMFVGATIAGVAAALLLATATGLLILPLARSFGFRVSDNYQLPFIMGMVGAHIVVACIAGMLVRDVWLRRAIAGCLESDRCPKCDYSLLGLPVRAGWVRCPECGFESELTVLGVTAEDLIATEEAP